MYNVQLTRLLGKIKTETAWEEGDGAPGRGANDADLLMTFAHPSVRPTSRKNSKHLVGKLLQRGRP